MSEQNHGSIKDGILYIPASQGGIVELPVWHKYNICHMCYVDGKWAKVINAFGKWNLVTKGNEMSSPPRNTKHLKDATTGRMFQINFLLHRVVFILETYAETEEKGLWMLQTPEGMQELLRLNRELPKIRQKDGKHLNCLVSNLDAHISEQMTVYREHHNLPVRLPEATPPPEYIIEDATKFELPEADKLKIIQEAQAKRQQAMPQTYDAWQELLGGKSEVTRLKDNAPPEATGDLPPMPTEKKEGDK